MEHIEHICDCNQARFQVLEGIFLKMGKLGKEEIRNEIYRYGSMIRGMICWQDRCFYGCCKSQKVPHNNTRQMAGKGGEGHAGLCTAGSVHLMKNKVLPCHGRKKGIL